MYLIIDKADLIVSISPRVCYVKTQSNGTTIMTEAAEATAVYTESDDSFWALRENTPGEKTYRVEEAEQVPEGVEISALRFETGEVIVDTELAATVLREKRTKLLRDTDWTQSLDAPISAESREEIRLYRQALRDITEQAGFPLNVTWPETPTVIKDDPDPVDTAFDTMVGGEGNA